MQRLFEKLRDDTRNWLKDGYPCQDYPLIGEILRYQFEGEADDRVHLKYLREPQFQSLELYWYLRLALKTPHFAQIRLNTGTLLSRIDRGRISFTQTGKSSHSVGADRINLTPQTRVRNETLIDSRGAFDN